MELPVGGATDSQIPKGGYVAYETNSANGAERDAFRSPRTYSDYAYLTQSERDALVYERTMSEATELQEQLGKRRWKMLRRTKMPFKLRMLLFAIVLAVLSILYCISFATGLPIGADINNWTDGVMSGFSDWLFGFAGNVSGRDLSAYAIPMKRLLTLGPVSYVIFSAFLALVAAGVVALVWSYVATRLALDDGTSNFRSELPKKKRSKGTVDAAVAGNPMSVSSSDQLGPMFGGKPEDDLEALSSDSSVPYDASWNPIRNKA